MLREGSSASPSPSPTTTISSVGKLSPEPLPSFTDDQLVSQVRNSWSSRIVGTNVGASLMSSLGSTPSTPSVGLYQSSRLGADLLVTSRKRILSHSTPPPLIFYGCWQVTTGLA